MKLVRCDRCKREGEPHREWGTVQFGAAKDPGPGKRDLCPSCLDDLKAWIKEAPPKEECGVPNHSEMAGRRMCTFEKGHESRAHSWEAHP